jgi:hypothetical protein
MGLVVLDMSMSLDGFVAGPNVGLERPIGGERLHDWMYAGRTDEEARTVEEATFTFVAEGTHRASSWPPPRRATGTSR